MKKLNIKTTKCEFVVVDDVEVADKWSNNGKYIEVGTLSKITEEQASDIVESVVTDSYGKAVGFKNYPFEQHPFNYPILSTAIESLHSLIKSKGFHLFENPVKLLTNTEEYPEGYLDAMMESHVKEEEKTFYKTYIFKIC